MKATQQQFKISVEQEILYGKLLKESAIAMGQVGRLPEFKVYQATDKLNKHSPRNKKTKHFLTSSYPYG